MRLVPILVPALLAALPLAACTSSSASPPADAGVDSYVALGNDASNDVTFDVAFVSEAAPVTHCTLSGGADPVSLCLQQTFLKALHDHAFLAGQGAAASWSSTTGTPDRTDAGVVPYSLDDTLAYTAAASAYLTSAERYGDTTLNGTLVADLEAVALQVETSFAPPATEYGGDLYFNLRGTAAGLAALQLASDGAKLDKLADAYARAIYTAHYVPLGVLRTPTGDAGAHDAGGALDATLDAGKGSLDAALRDGSLADAAARDAARHDAGSARPDAAAGADAGAPIVDGIFGNATGTGEVAYATADVATAAYALLDMVARNPTDPLVPAWLRAVRASLGHLEARAIEPTTGLFYTALLASHDGDAGTRDTLAPSTDPAVPANALLTDTQAAFVLAMVHAQYLVTSDTVVSLGGIDSGGPIVDAGVTGPFVPVLDLPFEAWADAALKALHGTPALYDKTAPQPRYHDGYLPGPDGGTVLTTVSTRPNAFLATAISRAFVNDDALYRSELHPLLQLLANQESFTVPVGSNLITVLSSQSAYLRGATSGFQPLTTGPFPTSYTTAATAAVVQALNEQLFGVTH